MRILVVDDNAEVGRVIAANLRQRGFEVVTVETASQAQIVLTLHSDIRAVLCDVELGPGETGVTFYYEVRERVTRGGLGFAFMSGGMKQWVADEISLIGKPLFGKPIDFKALVDFLRGFEKASVEATPETTSVTTTTTPEDRPCPSVK